MSLVRGLPLSHVQSAKANGADGCGFVLSSLFGTVGTAVVTDAVTTGCELDSATVDGVDCAFS